MSLDNDHEFRQKVNEVQEQLMEGVKEQNTTVRKLVSNLEDMKITAFGGGYSATEFKSITEQIDELQEQVDNGTIACDTPVLQTAIEKARDVNETYKGVNSFEAKADDRELDDDIDPELHF